MTLETLLSTLEMVHLSTLVVATVAVFAVISPGFYLFLTVIVLSIWFVLLGILTAASMIGIIPLSVGVIDIAVQAGSAFWITVCMLGKMISEGSDRQEDGQPQSRERSMDGGAEESDSYTPFPSEDMFEDIREIDDRYRQ